MSYMKCCCYSLFLFFRGSSTVSNEFCSLRRQNLQVLDCVYFLLHTNLQNDNKLKVSIQKEHLCVLHRQCQKYLEDTRNCVYLISQEYEKGKKPRN